MGNLNIINQWGNHKKRGEFWNFSRGKQKGVEHDFWFKFSGGGGGGEENLGGNYNKINPIAFVHNSNYACFFRNPIYLGQKYVKQNGVRHNEWGNMTQMSLSNVQWRNNIKKKYENLIVQIHVLYRERHSQSKVYNVSCRWYKFS